MIIGQSSLILLIVLLPVKFTTCFGHYNASSWVFHSSDWRCTEPQTL